MGEDFKGEDGLVVRARGLPWSCTEDDVRKFFNDPSGECITQIRFTFNREGRPSGEAYVDFNNENSFQEALMKDHEKMGHRYIEVFQSKRAEMDHVLKARGKPTIAAAGNDDAVVRLRGLPFGCTKEEITNFFSGLEILPDGITMPLEGSGKASGEAFVQFADTASADKALEKHMQNIAHRYIEVFRSSFEEHEQVCNRMSSGTGYAGGRGAVNAGRGGRGGMNAWTPWSSGVGGPMGGPARPGPYDRPAGYAGYGRGGYGAGMGGGGGWGVGAGNFGGTGWGNRSGSSWNGGGGGYNSYGGMGGYGGGGAGYGVPYGQGTWGSPSSGPAGWSSGLGMGRGQSGGPIRPTGGRGSRAGGSGMSMMGGGGGAGGGTFYSVKMRGLPFNANEGDINDFFAPLSPANITLLKEFRTNRPSGEAKADFFTLKDAQLAMKKDKAHMGTRYIELFLEGATSSGNGYTDFASDSL